MEIVFILIGLILGCVIAYLWTRNKFGNTDLDTKKTILLKEEIQSLKLAVSSIQDKYERSENDLNTTKDSVSKKEIEIRKLDTELATATTKLEESVKKRDQQNDDFEKEVSAHKLLKQEFAELNTEKSELRVKKEGLIENIELKTKELNKKTRDLEEKTMGFNDVNKLLATELANGKALKEKLDSQKIELQSITDKHNKKTKNLEDKTNEFNNINTLLATEQIKGKSLREKLEDKKDELQTVTDKHKKKSESLENKIEEYNKINSQLAEEKANNKALQENLEVQKNEIEKLGKKFNLEFQNIANKILEEKTKKFTDVNKESLETILKPLGKNINEFKEQVKNSYDKESKERFSLEEQVKKMAELNKQISAEAHNLTTALKGEAKTQGNWGEMILESILEKSGLRKGEEYFIEHQLMDENGVPLKSDSENKKMRPDAVIKYPDNRSVIIDSKVSLNAFTRYLSASDKVEQEQELKMHILAMKNHITALSSKGYDDYDKALDFVLMFVPSEPAYIAAMQGDPNLWNFAYDKRILLINPTNLITALKLIVDLWKREYQNQNAIEIANRGAKLYDKFVGFVDNLEAVGSYMDRAKGKYDDAYKQLSTGNDNLVTQATKLKNLGIKNKKSLSKESENLALE